MKFRRWIMGLFGAAIVFGAVAVLTPPAPAKGPKQPPCSNCPATIVVGSRVCTLTACGSDCVYTCPF